MTPLELVPAKNNVCSCCYEQSSDERAALIHAAVAHCGYTLNYEGRVLTCGNCGCYISTHAATRTLEELTIQFRRHYKYHALLVRLEDTCNSHDQWVCRACGMQFGASCMVDHLHKHIECPSGMSLRCEDAYSWTLLLVCNTCGKETSCLECAKAHAAREKALAFAHAMFQTQKLGAAETVHVMHDILGGCASCQYHGKTFVPDL
jgi:hypothetical protein